jgi:hypothetical protein
MIRKNMLDFEELGEQSVGSRPLSIMRISTRVFHVPNRSSHMELGKIIHSVTVSVFMENINYVDEIELNLLGLCSVREDSETQLSGDSAGEYAVTREKLVLTSSALQMPKKSCQEILYLNYSIIISVLVLLLPFNPRRPISNLL